MTPLSVAIFAIDPGTTTGVARGTFERSDSVWDGLAAGSWESYEEEGSPAVQAWSLMGEFLDWREQLRADETPVEVILVMEDFVIRLGQGASSRRELLDPVRVASGCEALCWTRNGLRWMRIEYQQPSEMGTYTNERLRDHGMWVRGASTHRHDATRHMIRRYASWLKQ